MTVLAQLFKTRWLMFVPFKAYWLFHVPPGLTFKNYTCFSHCVKMLCVEFYLVQH